MLVTRWIVHCDSCGYLLRPEYPSQWVATREEAYSFHHKREAATVVLEYSRGVREHLFVEPVYSEKDAIFD